MKKHTPPHSYFFNRIAGFLQIAAAIICWTVLEETLMAAGLLVGGLIVMAIAEVIFAMSLAAFHSERIADILERQELEHAQEKRRADLNKIESRFDRDPLGIYRQKDEEPEEAE